ncbi:hypothetical protein [Mesorhizobium sp. AA22]|uniref:hypothetical protein n=1 Tax=Mesorhizobium sp. AA22 TaxID=1854057 RepID=UPI0007EDBC2D|nr:hypothetical protein [Mesorhizobium sp. AA22]QIA24684.1 hypothetical protein A9K68_024950 [Mesorhizobium sp. AA22]
MISLPFRSLRPASRFVIINLRSTKSPNTARPAQAGRGNTTQLSSLKDAEETLLRLRSRQKQIDVTAAATAEMEQSGDPAAVSELAAAGCGTPLKSSADAVLDRLASRIGKPA